MSPFKSSHRRSRVAAVALLSAILAGCAVGPDYQAPAPPSVGTYTAEPQSPTTASAPGNAGAAQHFNPTADIPAQWWLLFQSPQLDRMVREALDHSPTLTQAIARLTQAQEESNARTGAARYPELTGNASVQRELVNLAALGVPFPNPPPFNLLNGSVAVSYALDLFGKNRRLIEGLNAQADYQNWQVQGARLMLAGNVVSAGIRQAQLRSQIEITHKMVAAQERTLAITEQRFRGGGVSEYDVRSQRSALAQTQASLPLLANQFDVVNHQLAVLMGQMPANAKVEEIRFDQLTLPQELPASLPSSLVRKRPDIRAAEALLHQACANVGVATADLYPQIELSASVGAIGTSFANGGPMWNFGGQLAQPIFKGGSLRAEKRKAVAAYEEAGSAYQETVLQAFGEVANVLRAIEHDAQAFQARSEAAAQADGAYQIAVRRYDAGGISQVALLDAQRQQLQTALDQVSSQAARYSDSATLFQALGGGWWNETHSNLTKTTRQK
jgi:NodT family efflux transporter outer membrane factor (OMF) lipoprotein